VNSIFWKSVNDHFAAEANAPAGVIQTTPEPLINAPDESKRATSDFIGLRDESGLPDWRKPFVPQTEDASELDAYAASRSVPDAPQASCYNPRVNPSAHRIV
jgi:hypothetical protein